MFSRLIRKFHTLRDTNVLRMPNRAAEPYLTHIPILLSVPRWRCIGSVLEFGCGAFSTRAFLEREYFPDLERLESYENDPVWAERISERLRGETRLNLNVVNGALCNAVRDLDLDQFDLIFVDDAATGEERTKTIRTIAAKHPRRALVLVHDFEYLPYRQAARSFRNRFRFTGLNPNTGILWNTGSLPKAELHRLNNFLRQQTEQEDIGEWANVLRLPTSTAEQKRVS